MSTLLLKTTKRPAPTMKKAAVKKAKPAEGLVKSLLQGRSGAGLSSAELVLAMKTGLAVHGLEELRSSLDVPKEKLASMLGLSKATLHRRAVGGLLDHDESDRVIRFARLMGMAIQVMETEENARRWLKAPQYGLGGAIPLEYARSEVGAREVEDLLGRIEYGVFS